MDINKTIKNEKVDDKCLNVTTACEKIGKCSAGKRKKIRRLADTTKTINNKPASKCKRVLIFTSLFTFTVALLMGHYFTQNNTNTKHILKEFLKNYRNQYSQIVHGKQNYCDQTQPLDTSTLFEHIRQNRILNQDKALQQIEVALRNDSNFNAIVLAGPVGVGKSLFMRSLVQNFPWQENVFTYAWNTFEQQAKDKFHSVRLMIENLSECGQNLLVIENLKPSDRDVAAIAKELIMESMEKKQKRVIIFFVFSINTMLIEEKYEKESKLVQSLAESNVVINFALFAEKDIRDCIQRTLDLENLTLTSRHFDEIVNTIDPFKSGCKNVHAKVLMYGKPNTKDNL